MRERMRAEREILEKLRKIEIRLRSVLEDPALVGGGLMISLINQSNALKWVLELKEEL
jgi:hypothetical protein